MNPNTERMKKILVILSYVLVAAAASLVTLLLFCRPNKLVQLEQIIQKRFVGQADKAAMEDAAARAMVNSLGDRWSYYVSAEDYSAFQEGKTNSYVGVGITILQREDGTGFDIVTVLEGGPADEAGILPGDILIAADGQSVAGMSSDGPAAIIKGKAGTKVSIIVLRDGEELTFSVTRRKVETAVASGKLLDGDVGYVKIINFNDRCAEQTIAVVEDLLAQGAKALVFDVRHNSGGYVHEMVKVLDYLLPEGELFRSVSYDGKETLETSDADCLEMPMAVLVNAESYSAAEFFAAALREYDWAVVVGEATCGKGYYQNTFVLSDGSAVGLSVGQYYTPKGVSLAEEGGLVPDVVIPVEGEMALLIRAGALLPEEDPQLAAAIAAIQS